MNPSAATPAGTNTNTSMAAKSPMLANTGANVELVTAALLLLAIGIVIMLVFPRRRKA
jgi:LPXTG-motif cell wall-anchored protein